MIIRFCKIWGLTIKRGIDRLKTGQSTIVLTICIFMNISCGKVINQKRDLEMYQKNISFLALENQCKGQVKESSISKSIRDLYLNAFQNSPQSFFSIPSRQYNYDTPMILSFEKMNKRYQKLKDEIDFSKNAEEIFYLYHESKRYESQKCSFNELREKKKFDIRSYLELTKEFNNKTCEDGECYKLDDSERFRENIIDQCKSFFGEVKCKAEFGINQKNRTVDRMFRYYYRRFKNERFNALFKLRPDHQKYHCQKLADDRVIMNVKVLKGAYPQQWPSDLLKNVEEMWSNKKFTLRLDIVNTYSDGTITLIPIDKGISYVSESNNRIVYLSTQNDVLATKRILAHEFGHVLGFMDCYIEFFDDTKKELVYYEASKDSNNIMCSLREGVQVEDEYLGQLAQSSCLFN